MNDIETHDIDGLTVTIFADPEPQNFRDDEDPEDRLVTIACSDDHRSYRFGDDDAAFDISKIVEAYAERRTEQGDTSEPHRHWAPIVKEWLIAERGAIESTMVGLALTDHSGLYLHVDVPDGSNAGDTWDTAFIGWAYVSTGAIPQVPMSTTDQVRETVVAEAKAYGQYLSGDVYGYEVESADGEFRDSLWGIYGLDEARSQGLDAAKEIAADLQRQLDDLAYRSQVDLDAALELARKEARS